MIQIGFIREVLEGGKFAKVETVQREVLNNVVLLHPYGESSNIQIDQSSQILLFFSLGSKSNCYGVPFNALLQPSLEAGEKAVGNFKVGNKITFKANGDIEVLTTNDVIETLVNKTINASGSVTINASTIDLADAIGLVLNDSATMQVVIAGGSSAGTYPVDIVSAGQTKVSA